MATLATTVLLRFDEQSYDVSPSDAAGNLLDMRDVGGVPTSIVPGFTGNCRRFSPTDDPCQLETNDAVPGSTLSTRDVTIDAIVRWDFDGQVIVDAAQGFTMAVVCTRGTFVADLSDPPEQHSCYSMCLRVVSQADRIGELLMCWHDATGSDVRPFGGQFEMPSSADNGFMLLTVTRHWISPQAVEIQCYVNDVLVGDVIHSLVDDIGGSTIGTFNVGGVAGLFDQSGWFVGDIDELRVRNYHVSAQEVSATYLRMAKWQTFGYSMIKQLAPPRAPISDDPASLIQRMFRLIGHSFGYAMAQVDNFKENLLPDQAFGVVLERWESITQEAARPPDTTKSRRRRVVGHIRQRQGVSPPGVANAVADLLAIAPSQVGVLAFSHDVAETFATGIDGSRWWRPNTAGITWTGASDKALRIALSSGVSVLPISVADASAKNALISAQGGGVGVHFIATMIENAVMPDQGEAGILFADWQTNTTLYFGVRNVAGTRGLVAELNVNGIIEAATVLATGGSIPIAPLMLHLYQLDAATATYRFEWSTGPWGSNAIAGLTIRWDDVAVPAIRHPLRRFDWAGLYARSLVGGTPLGAALDVKFTSPILRSPGGSRPFLWYVFRDPSLPGTPDIIGAQRTAQRIAHAHTKVGIVTTLQAVCDSLTTQADNTPMGAI